MFTIFMCIEKSLGRTTAHKANQTKQMHFVVLKQLVICKKKLFVSKKLAQVDATRQLVMEPMASFNLEG